MMKKIALFVALVLIFGGLLTIGYIANSRYSNASNRSSIEKCECEDPAKCKAEGKCDGECEDGTGTCENVECQITKPAVTETTPYVPPCCREKGTK